MKSIDIRNTFIDFFKSKQHIAVPSAPVVPENDPTLLFTNAGMNQFKPYFLGDQTPPFSRAVNSQPCIRVSGKHNDLEDVGLDTYHHTSFEMLGNWSFGDYYKKEAIIWAWELLTEHFKFPKAHLLATVFEDDEEAFELWRTHTDIQPNHIVKCGKKDNFWEMGATGPCGPCSELHIDLHPNQGAAIQRDPDNQGLSSRYMELWNLVFIQYNRQASGMLDSLPACHVDTGAGLERLAAQLQGVSSNYDTACFKDIIHSVESLVGVPYDGGKNGVLHRVIADHIRTVCFGISDNVLPSNDGRGYVLRRLIRRALRFASQAGKNEPFLYQLVPVVNDTLGGHYPNIVKRESYIADLVKAEEQQFLRTLSTGLGLFETMVTDLKKHNQTTIDGQMAFKLYDTYGFPFDLTQVMAKENQMNVDEDGFNQALNTQKERSRQARTETIQDGKDESLTLVSSIVEPVQHGVYIHAPGGGEARIPVNDEQRFGIAQNHTSTHLLHEALRQVLGEGVHQAGSLVDVNRLRFDFTYHQSITKDQLHQIEALVNQWIREDHPITITQEPIEDAKKRGAHAMFGEKYGDEVRVVCVPDISIELCAGNHVFRTQALEVFKIVSESAIAAGTRRIEALVGNLRVDTFNQKQITLALAEYKKRYDTLQQKAKQVGYSLPKAIDHIDDINDLKPILTALNEHGKSIEQQLKSHDQDQVAGLITDVIGQKQPFQTGIGDVVIVRIKEQPLPILRDLSDQIASRLNEYALLLVSENDASGHAIAKVSKKMSAHVKANQMIQELTQITGGKGGGRDQMAQAGGLQLEHIDEGIAAMRQKYA